jgi:hypothetical protein
MALRHFFQLMSFLGGAADYISADKECLNEAGEVGPKHRRYHRVIIATCVFFGLIGFVIGVAFIIALPNHKHEAKDFGKYLLAPLIFLVEGLIFGVSLACSFAPTSFLKGPVGRKWMQLIGAESVLVARIVCLIITTLFLSFFAVVAWGAWLDMNDPNAPSFF